MKRIKEIKNRIVLITGASSGLGEQIAYQMAKKGAIVINCARNLDKLEQVAKKCRKFSKKTSLAYQLDVSDCNQVEKIVDEIESKVGPIDILINSAGFGKMDLALNFKMDIAKKMFETNVFGTMNLCKYVGLKMAQRKLGVIVNIISMAGKIATPKSSIYSASKFAVLGYTNALRLELKPLNIKVISVNPGPINTPFFKHADVDGEYIKKLGSIVLDSKKVAVEVIRAIEINRREVNLPRKMEFLNQMYHLFPRLGDYLTGGIFNKK